MKKSVFSKPFTQQEAIPASGIEAALQVMQTGRLHRYNSLPGEIAAAAQLEREFAAYMGQPYCLACTSGGYALHIALKAAGIKPGEPVLCNAFTLAPVPGAIDNAGGKPVLVEIDRNYCVDLTHLERMMQQSKARFFLISHMRGHIADMDAVTALCRQYDVTLIEDCAHTMGASWNGKKSGRLGKIACFSTQTYKHMNSGEGGLLTTDDDEIMARAIIYSGSYMLYERHGTLPAAAAFADIKLDTPQLQRPHGQSAGNHPTSATAAARWQLHPLERALPGPGKMPATSSANSVGAAPRRGSLRRQLAAVSRRKSRAATGSDFYHQLRGTRSRVKMVRRQRTSGFYQSLRQLALSRGGCAATANAGYPGNHFRSANPVDVFSRRYGTDRRHYC